MSPKARRIILREVVVIIGILILAFYLFNPNSIPFNRSSTDQEYRDMATKLSQFASTPRYKTLPASDTTILDFYKRNLERGYHPDRKAFDALKIYLDDNVNAFPLEMYDMNRSYDIDPSKKIGLLILLLSYPIYLIIHKPFWALKKQVGQEKILGLKRP